MRGVAAEFFTPPGIIRTQPDKASGAMPFFPEDSRGIVIASGHMDTSTVQRSVAGAARVEGP
jgi:hypothetical protein